MTSFRSPASDQRRAAQFFSALLDGTFEDAVAVWDRADREPGGRYELICGLAMAGLEALLHRYGGPSGLREQLALTLLDPDVSDPVR